MELNEAKKDYCIEMHTAEHILNQTMVRMFGCARSMNAHIERKKSKCDYYLPEHPSDESMREVEQRVNEVIRGEHPVTAELMSRAEAFALVDLSKLSAEAGDVLRIVRVGEYDACACIGQHVQNTVEIGRFIILNYDYEAGRLRVRFKVEQL